MAMSEHDFNGAAARAETEIRELHEFFQQWYRGALGAEAFRRFEDVVGPAFEIVLPDAEVLDREEILDAVRSRRGQEPDASLWIREVHVVEANDQFIIARYQEWQRRDDADPQGRLSTAVFSIDETAPNGLIWRHVHETWLEQSPPDFGQVR